MKKKLLLLLAVLMSAMAAQAATDYGFSVAGITVTSDNCNNIVSNYITSGTVYYVPSSNTLYMNNVTITMTGDYNRVINNLENDGLKVQFSGTCNLKAQDASVIRVRKHSTTLYAPSASTVVNITGVNDCAIYMATDNYPKLYFEGPGTFIIKSTAKPALEGQDNDALLDSPYYVYFKNVKATLSSTQDNVVRLYGYIRFNEGSSVRFKATNNSSKSVITRAQFIYDGNETILEPLGAYSSGDWDSGTVYDANGNRVIYDDVYVSDDYVLINATNFPDANFRNALLNIYPKGYLSQSDINSRTSLSVSNKSISSLTGISYFTELQYLYCSNNSLTTLQLKNNPKLKYVDASNNQLLWLDVTNCTQLNKLICNNNKLGQHTTYTSGLYGLGSCYQTLNYLDCSYNSLPSLSLFNYSNLMTLKCNNNTTLTTLTCYNDDLTILDVTGCTALKELRCYYNANLSAITGLANCTAITYLDCEDCAITDLSAVGMMYNIEKLYARNNRLTTLSLSQMDNLTTMRVSGNTSMTSLTCYACALASLDVTGCTSMTYLDCSFNYLTSLSVSGCNALKKVEVYANKITNSGMTTLVNSLPTRTSTNKGELMVLYNSGENNVFTSAHANAAAAKYWTSYRHNGSYWAIIPASASLRGDVTGDGTIDINDVTRLIDVVLGKSVTYDAVAADCNTATGNGSVDINDVTALINYVLSGSW